MDYSPIVAVTNYQKLYKKWLKATQVCYYLIIQKVRIPNGSHWTKIKVSVVLYFSGDSRRDSVPLPFFCFKNPPVFFDSKSSSSIFKTSKSRSSSHAAIPLHLSLLPSFSTCKDSWDYIETTQIIKNNLITSGHWFTPLIASATQFLFSCKLTRSWILEIKAWKSLSGDIILSTKFLLVLN